MNQLLFSVDLINAHYMCNNVLRKNATINRRRHVKINASVARQV